MIWTLLAVASSAPTVSEDRHALERMVAGDQSGLAEIYDRHGRLIYALALRIVRDPGDAEDVTQEVFVQAWRQADRFNQDRGYVVAWLLTMARARSIDLLRRRKARPGLVDAPAPGQDIPDASPL